MTAARPSAKGWVGEAALGTVAPARMVSPDSRRAYLGDTGPLLQLRWLLGFTLVLFCGYAIAVSTDEGRTFSFKSIPFPAFTLNAACGIGDDIVQVAPWGSLYPRLGPVISFTASSP